MRLMMPIVCKAIDAGGEGIGGDAVGGGGVDHPAHGVEHFDARRNHRPSPLEA